MAELITRTNIRLISSVPFYADYKHSRWFDTKTAQSSYFENKPVVFSSAESNFQRIEGRFFFKCNMNIEKLENVNYMYFTNASEGNKRYYAFVTHLEYENNSHTRVYFQLDVLQSFMFDMDFKESYVAREHMERYQSDTVPRINTIDEGLYYGEEYDIKNYYPIENPHKMRYFVIVSKSPLHDTGGADDENASFVISPQPLSYYYIPFGPEGINAVYIKGSNSTPLTPPDRVMDFLSGSEENVNKVVSFYVTDDIGIPPRNVSMSGENGPINFEYVLPTSTHELFPVNIGGAGQVNVMYVKKCTEFIPEEFTVALSHWLQLAQNSMPIESKTLMSPYHWIELQDYRGNVVKYRPEFIRGGGELTIVRRGSLGTSNKVSYSVKNYNQDSESVHYLPQTEHEFALIDNNPNDVSVLNEHLAAFLQGNRNQIQNQQNVALTQGVFSALSGGIGVAGARETSTVLNGGLGSGPSTAGMAGAVTSGTQGLANTALTIQGINAKQKDIANVPPSISKMGGNTAYDFGHGLIGAFVVYKGIKAEYHTMLTDYFRAYGYKCQRFKIPNFHTRKYFNYIETVDCIIEGTFNNKYLLELKNVFNNGVTLWHTDNIGNYALSNDEI